jgi:hypothetical protein
VRNAEQIHIARAPPAWSFQTAVTRASARRDLSAVQGFAARDMALSAPEGLKGLRDRALLLLGFAGAFRRSLGYFLPVNSKKAEAGTKQRLLSAKPSDRQLKTGTPPGRPGGKLKVMGTSSISLPAARMTGPVSLILMSSACGRSSSLCRLGITSSRACIISQ